MEKNELYLSDEGIAETFTVKQPYFVTSSDRRLSKASADYAIKKVIETIENPFEGYIDVIENIRMAKSQGFERFRETLKKLVEGS